MPEQSEPVYAFEKLLASLRYIEAINDFWMRLAKASARPCLAVAYEETAHNPDPVAVHVARWLKIPLDPKATLTHIPRMERQATQRNVDWKGRFQDELKTRGVVIAPVPFGTQPQA